MLVSGLLSRESQPQNCCTIKAVSRSTHRISLGFLIRAVQVVTLTNSKKQKTSTNSKKITTTPTPTTPKPKHKFKFTFQRVSFRPQLPSLLEPRPLPRDESQVFLTAGWYHFCSWITWVLFYIFLYKVSRNSRWSQPLILVEMLYFYQYFSTWNFSQLFFPTSACSRSASSACFLDHPYGLGFCSKRNYTVENSHFEPQNGGLEDDFPVQLGDFLGSILIFSHFRAGMKLSWRPNK